MTSFSPLWRDGWRSLRRSVGTTVAAALLLGAGFAISLIVNSIAMSALAGFGSPIPASVVAVGESDGNGNASLTLGTDVVKLRQAFPELLVQGSAVRPLRLSLGGAQRNQSVSGALVAGRLFETLGWPMLLGRGFQDADADSGAVVLGFDLWQQTFAGDPAVIGRTVQVDGRAVTVIGVLPDHRSYPFHEQLYLAHALDSRSAFLDRYWDVTVNAASPDQLTRLNAAIQSVQASREQLLGDVARMQPLLQRSMLGNGVPAESQVMIGMLILLGGLLLILASSNAGGLLLVHWLARSRELATRSALGSTRRQLFLVCLVQSLLLVLLALTLAHAVAAVLLALLESYLHTGADGIPTFMRLTLHPGATWPVLSAALVCVLLVAAPVLWRLRDPNLQAQIRAGERGNSHAGWLGSGLFGLQCCLSAVTVLLALLCAQGAREMLMIDSGLTTEQVLTARFSNADPATQERIGKQLQLVLAEQPGLSSWSIAGSLPMLVNSQARLGVGERNWSVEINPVDAGFASVYGVQLERGEWINEAQVQAGAKVAVLDRAAAELLFPGRDPLGLSFTQQQADGTQQSYRVQGVTAPVRTTDGVGPDLPSVFTPMSWTSSRGLVVAVRTRSAEPLDFAPKLEQLAKAVDPALALDQLRSFAQVRHVVGSAPRLIVTLFAPLGGLAVLLAATGLAALLGSLVARRMREMGIRRALGAGAGSLLLPLLSQLLIWGGSGLLLGLTLSWPLADSLSQGLFGGAVLGALTYLITLSTIALALAAAAAAPVRRALRVDPMLVLRQE